MRTHFPWVIATLLLFAVQANAATVHHYRFESDPGFGVDSAGNGDLAGSSAQQLQLPASGRGAGFPKGFNLGSPASNITAADFDGAGPLTSTIGTLPDGFTIEAFVRFDTLPSPGTILATDAASSSVIRWNFQVRMDGFGGTSPGELILAFPGGSFQPIGSNFVLAPGTDYYVAASFQPGTEAVFYLQDLTAGSPLQVSQQLHSISSPTTSSGVFGVGGSPGFVFFALEGILDEVRLSDTVLDQNELLISIVNTDVDGDGIANRSDNCVFVANADQIDSNEDAFGNACDADVGSPDGAGMDDCLVNFTDLGVVKDAFFSTPASPNWNPDADFNGDELVNFGDLGIMKDAFFGSPGPSGLPNGCD